MKNMKDKIIEDNSSLSDEEFLQKATVIFARTLNGLGRDDEYRITIKRGISCSIEFCESTYSIHVNIPAIPEDISLGMDIKFKTLRDAAKNLALCACLFSLHHAAQQLATFPDEQCWMVESTTYWHKLKDEVTEFKDKYLV
jgi:hypothetical protein